MTSYNPILSITTFNWFNPKHAPWEKTYYSVRLAILFLLYKQALHSNIIPTLEKAIYDIFAAELTANEEKIYQISDEAYKVRRNCIENKIADNNKIIPKKEHTRLIDTSLGWTEHPSNFMWIDPIMKERLSDRNKDKLPHIIMIDLCDTLLNQYKKNTADHAKLITMKTEEILTILTTHTNESIIPTSIIIPLLHL